MLDPAAGQADVEHASLFLDVLGQPVWQQPGGDVVQHDVRPFPALHRVDRRQRDPVIVGSGRSGDPRATKETGSDRPRTPPTPRGRRDRHRGLRSRPGSIGRARSRSRQARRRRCGSAARHSTPAVVPPSGCRANVLHILREVSHLAGLPGAALAVQPAGKAAQAVEWNAVWRPGREGRRSGRAWGAGPPRAAPGREAPPRQHLQLATTPAPPAHRHAAGTAGSPLPRPAPRCFGGHLHWRQRSVDACEHRHVEGSSTLIEQFAHPLGAPGRWTILAQEDQEASRSRPPSPDPESGAAARISFGTRTALRVNRFDAAVTTEAGHR